ncbi:MAG TPA: M56 family metallopeptidase [Gemmatimonadales bacterium]|nr:M56 family metallopeptidase [Gemmatimonadales bacterium]
MTTDWLSTAGEFGPLASSWLLTYLVHSTILLGAAALVTRSLVQSHAIRDTLWKAALLGGIVTATVQLGLGVTPLGGARALVAAATPAPGRPSLEPSTYQPHTPVTVPSEAEAKPAAEQPAPDQSSPAAPAELPPAPASKMAWTAMLLLGWVGAASLLLLYFFLVRLRLVLRLGRRVGVEDGDLTRLLEALRRQAGIRRAVRLTTAEGLTSPVALGLSEICIPAEVLTELDREQQASMLAHELAHLARFDPLWLTVSCLIELLLFFQPLNRLARRRMQDAAEYLCDDWAVRRTGSGMTLAKCLVKVAEWVDTSPRAVPVSGMAERRSQLVARIHRLLENHAMTTPPRLRWLVPAALTVLAITAVAAPGFTVGADGVLDAQEPAAPAVRPAKPKVKVATAPVVATTTTSVTTNVTRPVVVTRFSGTKYRGDRVPDTTNAAVPALIAALSDPDMNVRIAAARSLGNLEDPRAIPALITATRDGNAKLRSAAFDALSNFEDPRIVEPMITALKDPDAEVRERAANTLGNLENTRAVQPLIGALADSSAGVREAAARSLGDLRDPAAAPALAGALKDANPDVREAAARSLGEFELTKAPPALIAALKDSDADVREAAAQSLGEIRDPAAVSALQASLTDANADVRETAVRALGEIGDSASVNALIAALKSSDPEVRRQAAQELGQRQ